MDTSLLLNFEAHVAHWLLDGAVNNYVDID